MYELLYKYIHNKTGIDQKAFSEFCYYFKLKKIKKNEIILMEGDTCKYNFFVNKGCLKFYSINGDGKEFTRYFAFEVKFGTDLTSFIDQKPSCEYIEALEPSEVLMISREDFFFLVDTVPQMNLIYRDILEMAYKTSQMRVYGFQGKSALEQLKSLVARQPKILSRLSNKAIASYLGITPYTLSRLKAELFKERS
jgi:CRP-like cAMP-binding protein